MGIFPSNIVSLSGHITHKKLTICNIIHITTKQKYPQKIDFAWPVKFFSMLLTGKFSWAQLHSSSKQAKSSPGRITHSLRWCIRQPKIFRRVWVYKAIPMALGKGRKSGIEPFWHSYITMTQTGEFEPCV